MNEMPEIAAGEVPFSKTRPFIAIVVKFLLKIVMKVNRDGCE